MPLLGQTAGGSTMPQCLLVLRAACMCNRLFVSSSQYLLSMNNGAGTGRIHRQSHA